MGGDDGLQNESIFSAVHEISRSFEILTPKTPPETPPGVGWVKLFWVRMIPGSIRTCMPNLVAVRRSCRKKRGGGVQTDTHQTCQVSRITRESHGFWQFLKAHGRDAQCSRIFVNLTECCDQGILFFARVL